MCTVFSSSHNYIQNFFLLWNKCCTAGAYHGLWDITLWNLKHSFHVMVSVHIIHQWELLLSHLLLVFWISLPLVGIPACVSWKSQLISQIKSWIAKCHGNVLQNVFASCHRYGISDVMSISERWQQAQSEVENLTVEDTIIDNLQPGDRQYCILFQSLNAKDKSSQNTPKVSCNKELLILLPWKVDKQKAFNDSQGWWQTCS